MRQTRVLEQITTPYASSMNLSQEIQFQNLDHLGPIAGRSIRTDLMDKCNLHTILRLPTGIFYAQGVKTNVLFFQRGSTEKGNTKQVWIYGMRTNMSAFGKRIPLNRLHKNFEAVYWDNSNGGSPRTDEGESGRFRCFSREAKRGENLDRLW